MKYIYKGSLFVLLLFSHTVYSQWQQSAGFTGGGIVSDMKLFKGKLYASFPGRGVYSSSNDGGIWQRTSYIPEPNFPYFIEHNSRLLVLSYGRIQQTTDGTSWTLQSGPEGFINDVVIDGDVIYAATTTGLYVSANGGSTWTKNPEPLLQDNVGTIAVKGSLIFVAKNWNSNGLIFKSENSGASWSQIATGGQGVTQLAFQGPALFMNQYGSGVYRSSNDGATWQQVRTDIFGGKFLVTENKIYYSSYQQQSQIAVSENQGSTWTENNSGLPGFAIQRMYVSGTNLFIGTWGNGVYRTPIDNLSAWSSVNEGLCLHEIHDIEVIGNTIYAGTENSFIRQTSDGGETWTQLGASNVPSNERAYDLTRGDGPLCTYTRWRIDISIER